ncbi:hypothetical protein [Intestinibacter sp.]|uniref:hypothetical protein n=1 Tax=Intestinibacter sp. TaxID=1965304 RepID=UPI003F16F565
MFDGEVNNEQELVRELGSLLAKSKNATVKLSKVQLALLSDVEVCSLLINKAAEEQKKVRVTHDFEVFLQNIIKTVGSPRLSGPLAYKYAIINKLHESKELRENKYWTKLRNLTEYEKLLLKEYGLENLSNYINDIAEIFRIYNYGAI